MGNMINRSLAGLVIALTASIFINQKPEQHIPATGVVADIKKLKLDRYEEFMIGQKNGTPYLLVFDSGKTLTDTLVSVYSVPNSQFKEHSFLLGQNSKDTIKVGDSATFTKGRNTYYEIKYKHFVGRDTINSKGLLFLLEDYKK